MGKREKTPYTCRDKNLFLVSSLSILIKIQEAVIIGSVEMILILTVYLIQKIIHQQYTKIITQTHASVYLSSWDL